MTTKLKILDLENDMMEIMQLLDLDPKSQEDSDAIEFGGDCWGDCDMVKFAWNKQYCMLGGLESNEPYMILAFDKHKHPGHVKILEMFAEDFGKRPNDKKYFDYSVTYNTWTKWNNAICGVAYRGGQGYSYGIHVLRVEYALTNVSDFDDVT